MPMPENRKNETTVYVTKYALTEGIMTFGPGTGEIIDDKYFSYRGDYVRYFFSKADWFFSEDEAVARVSELAKKKLKSFDKQRSKLDTLAAGKVKTKRVA